MPDGQHRSTAVDPTTLHHFRAGHGANQVTNANEVIKKFLWQQFPVPISKAYTKIQWLQDLILSRINDTKQIYKDNIDLFERQLQILTLKQLYEQLNLTQSIFGAPWLKSLGSQYESREESLEKLEYFFKFQFGQQVEAFIDFLFEFLNHTSGKFNCMNIVGAPSSGKTYFAKLLKDACVTSGQILNMNKNSQFPFNNCVNKRLLHWDEPNFSPDYLEDLKMLFSGDDLPCNIKYSPHNTLVRTPVIVTANSNLETKHLIFV